MKWLIGSFLIGLGALAGLYSLVLGPLPERSGAELELDGLDAEFRSSTTSAAFHPFMRNRKMTPIERWALFKLSTDSFTWTSIVVWVVDDSQRSLETCGRCRQLLSYTGYPSVRTDQGERPSVYENGCLPSLDGVYRGYQRYIAGGGTH